MVAPADTAAHRSHHRQYDADDEQDDPDHQNKMGEGEGRDKAREQKPQNDEHDSGS